jgi:hypothetical protein
MKECQQKLSKLFYHNSPVLVGLMRKARQTAGFSGRFIF